MSATTVTVKVAAGLALRMAKLVESGRYPDADALLRDAISRMEQENERLAQLRALVREGFESGNPRELTPELWDELTRQAEEEERLGLPQRDEVLP